MNLTGIYRDVVLWAGFILLALAVFIFSKMIFTEQENMSTQESLKDIDRKKTENGLVQMTRPFFTAYIVPAIRGREGLAENRVKYRRKLISAGLKEQLTADEFMAFKFMLVLFFPLAAGIIRAAGMYEVPTWAFYILPAVGFFYPDFWINGLIAGRHKQVLKALPFVVDLLALSTEAGLDFIGAIQKVVEKAKPSPFVEELEQALKEIKVGSSRAEALRELAFRINMQEVNSFIAVLVSADQMGASIGKVLRQQSEQIRTLRFVLAEKAGAQSAQKLMFPTFVFILPAILTIMLAPFGLQAFLGGN